MVAGSSPARPAMKIITIKEGFVWFFIVLALIIGATVYKAPCVPDQIPSHWNAQGEVDGYASKQFTVLFFGGMILAVYLLTLFLPLIDPLKRNYSSFAGSYFLLRLTIIAFFCLLYVFVLFSAAGWSKLKINYFIIPLISAMMIVFGILMPKIKRNYFVGVRTPWTLHSDAVWTKTHKFAGRTFMAGGVLSFFSVFFSAYSSFWIFMTIILLASLSPVVYSYLIHRKV